ncbi:hypothetical protein JCM10213v2_004481 [Rhodosporidiobolus nylandii]
MPASADALASPPSSPRAQIALLRTLDLDADAALAANRDYQAQLLQALVGALEQELHAGADIKTVWPQEAGISEPALPWFKHFYGKDLPPNPDGEARDRYLAAIRSIPWSAAERAQLKQEVIAQNHRLLAVEAQQRGDDLAEAIAARDPKWFVENLEGLDWERMALVVDRRTPVECLIHWQQKDHPLLVPPSQKWTDEEKARLAELVDEFGGTDWGGVARELGYRKTEGKAKGKGKQAGEQDAGLTPEDDERIREAVALYGENWQAVARHTSLTSLQCLTRWQNTLHPSIKRGRWSAAEDDALRAAVAACGRAWTDVALRVTGRTDAQCRERWVNVIDPRLLDKKVWSEEEEALLLRLRDEEKLSWSEIARQGFDDRRTDNTCMRRYAEIQKRSLPEHERPRIGRPPKKRGVRGRPKKSQKQREKEARERDEEEAELDAYVAQLEEGGPVEQAVKPSGRRRKARQEEAAAAVTPEAGPSNAAAHNNDNEDEAPSPPPAKKRKAAVSATKAQGKKAPVKGKARAKEPELGFTLEIPVAPSRVVAQEKGKKRAAADAEGGGEENREVETGTRRTRQRRV